MLGLLNLFSGGALSQFSLFALGIMPYVTASIILQLMTVVIPQLEELQKEGEAGYAKINQYTRYLTVVLAAAQATGYAYPLPAPGRARRERGPPRPDRRHAHRRHGAADVDGRADHEARHRQRHLAPDLRLDPRRALPLGVSAWCNGGADREALLPARSRSAIVVAVVFIQEGQRRIPIQYAKRMVGPPDDRRRLDLHAAAREHGRRHPGHLRGRDAWRSRRRSAQYFPGTQSFVNRHFQPSSWPYLLLEAALIIVFTYFYTAVQFNPVDQADNLRKYGGYIPGIRPGPPTAQYLDRVLTRLTLPGALYLARDRGAAEHLHPLRRLLAGDLARARRHVRADRRSASRSTRCGRWSRR